MQLTFCEISSVKSSTVLDDALVEALARNEVGAVDKLLQHGASIDQFYMGRHSGESKLPEDELIALVRRASRS